MSVNPNGEAEVLKGLLQAASASEEVIVDLDFSTLAIRGTPESGQPLLALRHPQSC